VNTLSLDSILQQAITHQRAGELQQAERLYRAILQQQPIHADANHNLGVLAITVNKPQLALPLFKVARECRPQEAQFWVSYLDALIRIPQLETALAFVKEGEQYGIDTPKWHALKKQVVSQPSDVEIDCVVSLYLQKQYNEAEKLARQLMARFPLHSFAWKALGVILAGLNRFEEALKVQKHAYALMPHDADNLYNMGNTLRNLKRFSEAIHVYQEGIKHRKTHPETYNNLALTFHDIGRFSDAEACYLQAMALRPDNAEYFFNYGITLESLYRLAEAEAQYRKALMLNVYHGKAHSNLGSTLIGLGRLHEADVCFRVAKAIMPDDIEIQSRQLFGYSYSTQYSSEFRLNEAKNYGAIVAKKVTQRYEQWRCDLSPQRLRIGFVSGDFRDHSVGHFLENVLKHLQNGTCELFAYPTFAREDAVTARLKPYFKAWRPLFMLNDEAAARTIHQDGIHILIDLSGHTLHSGLPIFAWKPAPIQITWLGYLATTGVTEIDYIVGDSFVMPPDSQGEFIEKVWHLPQSYQCFTPPLFEVAVSTLPALKNGYITFGSFNNLTKITDAVITVWAKVLQAVPHSKLFLKIKNLSNHSICEYTLQRFAKQGIKPEQLILEGGVPDRKDLLAAYQRVDITLDPFPYPGVTTSVESLWMGVPVVTLKGYSFLSRAGESIAHNAGLGAWVAQDEADYVKKAVYFAQHCDALAMLRQQLRSQVLASPVFNAPQFAQNFENALHAMWHEHQT
jgi:protein O-GlcNAc transferase